MRPTNVCCSKCVYARFYQHSRDGMGFCKLSPPEMGKQPPQVTEDDFCGAWAGRWPGSEAVRPKAARKPPRPSVLREGEDALLPPAVVMDRTSLSRTTLWRLIKRGEFPGSVRISPGRVAWSEAAVTEWVERTATSTTS